MISRAFRIAAVSILAFTASAAAVQSRDLSFADRVKAQEAIERVYYSHQIGTDKPFEEAFPRDLLERKVVKYLKQSVALEKFWHTPVTAEMLEREVQRMIRGTRMPDRLGNLFASLDNDPVLIHECLARATLVDRLTHNFFAFDPRFHTPARSEADELYEALASGTLDPWQEHQRRTETESSRESADGSDLPATVGEVRPVDEEREEFQVQVLLDADDARLQLAIYRVEKTSWDSWWGIVSPDLNEDTVVSVTTNYVSIPREIGGDDRGWDPQSWNLRGDADPCDDYDVWDNGTLDDIPDPMSGHTAVWTGSVMVIWGRNSGWRYDPATDTWAAASTVSAPEADYGHTAVWTGSLMLVWGGTRGSVETSTGRRYDPVTDTWTAVSAAGAPSARAGHTAIWTGSLMLVWGGNQDGSPVFGDGGKYDPETDTWAAISLDGAPPARRDHTAVWTGDEMLVWGGWDGNRLNTGGRYDPATDSWTSISQMSAPEERSSHTAVWTGDVMVIWGGRASDESSLNTGGRYDPTSDSWTTTSLFLAPSARTYHTAVWTGNLMLVWGGWLASSGGQYHPASDSWTTISSEGAPTDRYQHTAVWTGDRMLIWGGTKPSRLVLNSGGRYDPATRTWTAIATTNSPAARDEHTAVWTGNLMLIWGGAVYYTTNTGGRYDPVTDNWTAISILGAPTRRKFHTAVWTGNLMLVWGGWGGSGFPDPERTGGRYDPATDTWTNISTTAAPYRRMSHTAVWTGDAMLIWGGHDRWLPEITGARYLPDLDAWMSMSTTGAPSARSRHTAVWTGESMLVWGGDEFPESWARSDIGGRYDPATDTWAATSAEGAPTPRIYHTAVWTGEQMLVWGGQDIAEEPLGTGGRYNPVTDTWTATSIVEAPTPRWDHTAVWADTRLVVWGGEREYYFGSSSTGGRYDPTTDTWIATSTAGAPAARSRHTAVWTGSLMLVWGGAARSSGGRYALGHAPDADGDGHTVCDGDCNEGDPTVYPRAPETNDGIDNQCPGDEGHGLIDELEGECGFHNPDDPAEFSWPAQPAAAMYEVARFAEADSPTDCTLTASAGTYVNDPEEPTPGRVFHYLVRAFAPFAGSWGTDSAGIERSDVCP